MNKYICGRITAYQKGVPEAFIHRVNNIDSYYLHGVSLMHKNYKYTGMYS